MSIFSSKGRMQDKFSANSKAKQGKLKQIDWIQARHKSGKYKDKKRL